jgi:peptide/nickel transport system substrate-binding protein
MGPGSPDFKPTGNPTKAKAYLAAAKNKGGACLAEANRITSDGFTVDVAKSATLTDTIPINTEAFGRAGIKINFNQIEPGSYYSTVFNPAKQSDMSSGGWAADWANASTVIPELFTSAGGFNLTQNDADPAYAAFEAKVAQAMLTTNRAKQAVLWKALDKTAMSNFWIMPTRFGKSQIVWGSKVGGTFFWVPQGCLAFGKLYVK